MCDHCHGDPEFLIYIYILRRMDGFCLIDFLLSLHDNDYVFAYFLSKSFILISVSYHIDIICVFLCVSY